MSRANAVLHHRGLASLPAGAGLLQERLAVSDSVSEQYARVRVMGS
jgi:hypothetical protein